MPASDIALRYRVKLLPLSHELEVTFVVDRDDKEDPLRLELPTWVPGAYAFMRYARNLSSLTATQASSGEALVVTRDGWSGFRVDGGRGAVALKYRVHVHDPDWGELAGLVSDDQAVLLGTHYLYAPAHPGPCEVTYEVPEGWQVHACAGATPTGATSFFFPDHVTLLDTPMVFGRFERITRDVQGVPFHVVFLDRPAGYERHVASLVDAFMRVAEEAHKLFGSFPFEHYTFVCTFNPEAQWGLEHLSSTMIALGPHTFFDSKERFSAVRVAAHELFHAWNVCRLRPSPLGKMDHARGSFPDALWVSEGFTRYYEFLLSVRAHECSPEEFFSNIVNYFRHLKAMPSYQRVTVQDSSRATFLNHGKYPGSINNTIDYYDHGMLVAFDLDVHLRSFEPPSSLDEAFRGFYEAFVGVGDGFTSAQLKEFLRARYGPPAASVITEETERAGRLSVARRLEDVGFAVPLEKVQALGFVLKDNVGPTVVNVLDTTPAGKSGLAPGDILLEVNEHPFDLQTLRFLIHDEETVSLTVRRGAERRRYDIPVREREQIKELIWMGSESQLAVLRTWLGREDIHWASGHRLALTAFDNFHGIQKVF